MTRSYLKKTVSLLILIFPNLFFLLFMQDSKIMTDLQGLDEGKLYYVRVSYFTLNRILCKIIGSYINTLIHNKG